MEVHVQYQKMMTSDSLTQILMKKLEGLEQKYSWLIKANVLFKTENDKTGEGKICEIELSAPGPRIFAKSNTDDFEKSMSKTIDDLKRQLEKRQATFSTH
ncbi:MAG: HPF/RaiA family ribosome-associated protein [Allomuricauda sp.]|jgi:putative sigma-54 modulation protein|uniref:HPF/RaiA family ribosome-associated protein n=2 Tax=unclassified Flagellimonas TaxID=2644544 RepID=A0AAU7N0Q8_9FLAO|nr:MULTISPECIES: HPF/RaiA family ribosome-associated protein [unclassified Allomuricauda]MBO6532471.1 HPF/RaiA family ribosome-associated protein [Allomuricauda sp.]MBO6589964.1 HPF/RaiA family ribosome-associated protein [Allomuricauda sp.]MBO6619590.1 HPF/RaiA family ribosome-associated protein [Allomuricauda sp.]MBO6645441.1 HPF/RaiA family ribosome-associated protein [Allomuricauda sp.]MBO6747649.1 HPF/RaiA family ribosome-associated protein [Allomuricauda sp.]